MKPPRKKRVFTDALYPLRCKAEIKLRDRSLAQCGRAAKVEGLCTQHHRIVESWSCDYCGGSDEIPPQHTQDCSRPGQVTR